MQLVAREALQGLQRQQNKSNFTKHAKGCKGDSATGTGTSNNNNNNNVGTISNNATDTKRHKLGVHVATAIGKSPLGALSKICIAYIGTAQKMDDVNGNFTGWLMG